MPTGSDAANDPTAIDETLQAKSVRIMQWMTGLSFLSQFLNYDSDSTRGHLVTSDPRAAYDRAYEHNDYTGLTISGSGASTGWDMHSLAIPVLAALAFIYLTRTHRSDFWMKWGHWIAIGMLVSISGGAQVRALGAALGAVAVAGAVWSALVHRRAMKGGSPPVPPAPAA